MRSENVPVADICVGPRVRTSVGNIDALLDSMGRLGLLHPLVLNSRRELVVGARRLAAAKMLKWAEVPCRIVETLDDAVTALRAELEENVAREPFTVAELVEIGRQLEELEKPAAQARKRAGNAQGGKKKSKLKTKKVSDDSSPTSRRTRDVVARALGVCGQTYARAKRVADAAESEPETHGDLLQLAQEKSIAAAHIELNRRRSIHGMEEPRSVPSTGTRAALAASLARFRAVLNRLRENDPALLRASGIGATRLAALTSTAEPTPAEVAMIARATGCALDLMGSEERAAHLKAWCALTAPELKLHAG